MGVPNSTTCTLYTCSTPTQLNHQLEGPRRVTFTGVSKSIIKVDMWPPHLYDLHIAGKLDGSGSRKSRPKNLAFSTRVPSEIFQFCSNKIHHGQPALQNSRWGPIGGCATLISLYEPLK